MLSSLNLMNKKLTKLNKDYLKIVYREKCTSARRDAMPTARPQRKWSQCVPRIALHGSMR